MTSITPRWVWSVLLHGNVVGREAPANDEGAVTDELAPHRALASRWGSQGVDGWHVVRGAADAGDAADDGGSPTSFRV